MELTDGRIVVTGASRGIGAATARAAATRGAHVHLLARTESALEATASDVRDRGGTATVHSVDLSDTAATLTVAERILSDGTPDAVVNNAGTGDWKSVPELTPAEMREAMAVPFHAAFDLTWALLPAMLDRDAGRIAVVTSPAAFVAVPGSTGYTASRAAMRGLADGLRADLYATNVGVTLVVPGVVETAYLDRNVRERLPAGGASTTLDPDETGEAIVAGLEADRSVVVEPFQYRLMLLFARLAPGLLHHAAARTGWELDDDAREAAPDSPTDVLD